MERQGLARCYTHPPRARLCYRQGWGELQALNMATQEVVAVTRKNSGGGQGPSKHTAAPSSQPTSEVAVLVGIGLGLEVLDLQIRLAEMEPGQRDTSRSWGVAGKDTKRTPCPTVLPCPACPLALRSQQTAWTLGSGGRSCPCRPAPWTTCSCLRQPAAGHTRSFLSSLLRRPPPASGACHRPLGALEQAQGMRRGSAQAMRKGIRQAQRLL